jgi:hypothetical protein
MAKKKATKARKAPARKPKRTETVKKTPKAAGKKKAASPRKKATKKTTRQTGVKILLHRKSGKWVELVGVKQIAAKPPDAYGPPWMIVDSRGVDHPAWPDVDRRVELGTGGADG